MRVKNPEHLAFIRQLPCCICLDNVTVEAAHIRMSDATISKPITGIGIKCDDLWTLPLCGKHHRQSHQMSEREFWESFGIDPVKLALRIYSLSIENDFEEADRVIRTHWHLLETIPMKSSSGSCMD